MMCGRIRTSLSACLLPHLSLGGFAPKGIREKAQDPVFRIKLSGKLPIGCIVLNGRGERNVVRKRRLGFEWGGLRLVLEAPEQWHFDWPAHLDRAICAPEDPDVHVVVHQLREEPLLKQALVYSHEGCLFEAGRSGREDYLLVDAGRRLARFDRDGSRCDVWLPPSALREGVFPLARPLDDLVILHGALARGALAVRATAAVRDGRALVVLGESSLADPQPDTLMWEGWLLIEDSGDAPRVHPLPSTLRSGPGPLAGAVLEGLHVADSGPIEDGLPGSLGSEAAAGQLLRFAFAPLAGWNCTERMLVAATRVAERVPMLHLGSTSGRRFGWRRARAPMSLVPPAGA